MAARDLPVLGQVNHGYDLSGGGADGGGEVLRVNRRRLEKTIFTAVLDEDSGRWMAIRLTDINQSDVQLLERQTNGNNKRPQPVAGDEISLEKRSMQLEQGELFRDVDQCKFLSTLGYDQKFQVQCCKQVAT